MSEASYKRLSVDEESQDTPITQPDESTGDKNVPVFSDIPLRTDDGGDTAELGEEAEFPDWIRLVEIGKPRRSINVDFGWTVREFKQRFFQEQMDRGCSVRLIYQGRLMQDFSSTLKSYNIVPNGFVHVVVSQAKGAQSMPGFQQPVTQTGCSHEEFDNGIMSDEQLARQLQTQDRDRDNDSVFVPMGRGGRFGARPEEEQSNNPSEFACGFVTGLLLGIWAFLFLLSPRWRQSRRFRSGVILGLLVNVVVTIAQRPSS